MANFFSDFKDPFLKRRVLNSIYIFIFSAIISVGILYLQAYRNYEDATMNRLALSLEVLDGQFSRATDAVNMALDTVTGNCETDQQALSNTMITIPSIQSLNVIRDNTIICSTYSPNIGHHSRASEFGPFNIITSELVVPDKSIAIVKAEKGDLTVTASLHGFLLFGVVKILNIDTSFHINTVGGWVNDSYKLINRKNTDTVYVHSSNYPYTISTIITPAKVFNRVITLNSFGLLVLMCFSLLISLLYFIFGIKHVVTSSIKSGIKKREFFPFAQGVTNKDGVVNGCEILVRWKQNSTLIFPDQFIPVAEESELIVPMSLQLINDTYEFFLQCHDTIPDGFHIAFNISPVQLTKSHAKRLIESVSKFRTNPKLQHLQIILEITERQIVSYTPETLDTINRLRKNGISIVIDDFGTGYSSLENILELNISGLKIDKLFIDRYPADELSANLIGNMMDLASRLNVFVVAEGVETKEQAQALKMLGVTYLQGYYYFRPVGLDEFHEKMMLNLERSLNISESQSTV